ncbi:MAG: sodium-dependent transporter [Lachnospiraceae bacterium]|nr:sodium-dependent transporter [Lachnospiraceae bacterium]
MARDNWSSRLTFILAAIGSAVGLGNAWRFPGLAAKHGGGAFLLVYLIALFLLGIPLLAMEIAMARRIHQGVPGTLRTTNKKAEHIGWIAVSNGFFISVYYAVVFAWVILMFFLSFKFAGFTGTEDGIQQASSLWLTTIKTTGTTSGYTTISWPVLACLVIAWGSCYYCIRNGSASVGKVVKYTVSLPVICLIILAVRGITMPGAGEGLAKLFIPDWSALSDSTLWVDAIGQVFYSLSVAMSIMFAYGSYLNRSANVAVDTIIIALADMLISVLAAIVMFSTMAGTGMLNNMTASGISTAFIVYPQAIVNLTNIPAVNAVFAFVFYFCLITLAIDSLFSIVEGTTTAISDKFRINKKKTTIIMCIIEFFMGIFFCTGAGLAWLDIVDNFINSYTLVLTGILEAIAIGWFFNTGKVLNEINKNTEKFKMPAAWFYPSIKVIIPVVLSLLFIWNLVTLFKNGGIYGANDGYSLSANIIGGWLIIALSIFSGAIVKLIVRAMEKKGFKEDDLKWDDYNE